MARLIGPSEASREVKAIVSTSGVTKGLFKAKALRQATYYVDPDPSATPTAEMLTALADIRTLDGVPHADSTVTIDAYSMLPLMQFPDGVDSLLVVADGGPPWRVYAREDDRLDALAARVTALEPGGSAAAVPATRTITAGTGLTGGGDLSANRSLAVSYGTTTGTAAQGNDARLSDARTPIAHASSHGSAGGDPVSLNGSQITAGTVATARLSVGTTTGTVAAGDDSRITGAVPATRTITAGTGLTGGGDLSANRSLAVSYGTAAGTAAQGNDSRITGAVQGSRQVIAGTGLTGGGDLSADRTLAVSYGTSAGTAAQGNDSRIAGAAQKSANLSDLADVATTLRNLGIDSVDSAAIVTPPRLFCMHGVNLTSGVVLLSYFVAPETRTYTSISTATRSAGAGATPTLCRMGIYIVAADGGITLDASVVNDPSLWAATNAEYNRTFTSPWNAVRGQIYAAATLIVSAAALPALSGIQLNAINFVSRISRLSTPNIGRVAGQVDLPNSVASASVIGFQGAVTSVIE